MPQRRDSSEPTSSGRCLVVMRHAKALNAGVNDFERALAPVGIQAATQAGVWLAAQGVRPDQALVSAALRTRQTWEAVCAGAGWDLAPERSQALYLASAESALDLVRAVEDEVRTLVVVGHNPTVGLMASVLDDGEGHPGAAALGESGYPPGTATVFDVFTPWEALRMGTARVRAHRVP